MIILGDSDIPFDEFERVYKIEDIKNTKPNSTLIIDFDKSLMKYCLTNDIKYALKISNITQAIYANNLGAKYLFVGQDIAKTIQSIAENYMFDSKVIAIIFNISQIEQIAKDNIDGVIFYPIFDTYDSIFK
jgi:hypothetical protein